MFICESFMEAVADKLNMPVDKLRVSCSFQYSMVADNV